MSEAPSLLDPILELLRARRGVDLSDYRRDTLERRVESRLSQLGRPAPEAYLKRLAEDPKELDELFGNLVIPVTTFWRDPEVYAALARGAVPQLFAAAPGGRLRAWVVGAATGEEAWSVAMLLSEEALRGEGRDFEVLATDIEAGNVEQGRAGRYLEGATRTLPPALSEKYLRKTAEGVEVGEALRAKVRFAVHDVVGPRLAPPEAVLASFELVFFRNVLIYFQPRLQQKALERVAEVLLAGGALVLGTSETLASGSLAHFTHWPGIPPELRVYQRRGERR